MHTTVQRAPNGSALATTSAGPYQLRLTYRNRVYGIRYDSYMATFAPSQFEYRKRLLETAERMRLSGRKRMPFTLVAPVEFIEVQESTVMVRFLMSGTLNQTFTAFLDPQKQDFRGSKGLRIDCVMEELGAACPQAGLTAG
ncbi:MAG: hypothetical protein KGI78_00360 [Patescibacteria group bacterium]|nr:hypothetical protein [Patescibacteria group bacterium]MDE1944845.1 hypothetical protein [Patescibacteria group bacterium]MDE2057291.1 hypothetical protein [Patescibacteria group bacterium]